jgi:hypothetical protein
MGDFPIVMGGDWNTCYCTLAIPNNIDVVNMINLPNPPNSKSLSKLCRKYKLVDPFRLLWPERKDYSYVPRDVTKINRSRLDFFVVSKGISHLVKKCNILPNTQSRLFDHKAVILEFTESKPPVCIPTILPRINNDPDINLIVEISAMETYITYCNVHDENRKYELLRNLDRCRAILRKAGPDPIFAGGGGDYINERNRSPTEIREILATFDLAFLQNSQLIVDNDDFLELLINNIRNDVIGYQAFILQMQKKAKRDLELKLDKLKKARDCDYVKISELEKELTVINDTEKSYILEKYSAFENANSERITPYFLKVINGSKNLSSLNSLKDNDGRNFNSDLERKNYIRDHFVKIYKKEIVQNPLVTESRLNEHERTTLDEPLSMDELNKALDGANGASAAGIDGLNTKFIKKFWYILSVPLLKYAETCFEKGRLTR